MKIKWLITILFFFLSGRSWAVDICQEVQKLESFLGLHIVKSYNNQNTPIPKFFNGERMDDPNHVTLAEFTNHDDICKPFDMNIQLNSITTRLMNTCGSPFSWGGSLSWHIDFETLKFRITEGDGLTIANCSFETTFETSAGTVRTPHIYITTFYTGESGALSKMRFDDIMNIHSNEPELVEFR